MSNSVALGYPSNPLKSFSFSALFLLFLLFVMENASSQVTESLSPMKKSEKESLYAVIQSLAGSSWNGSDLFPDPCGWTPIEGVSCDLIGDFWYVTAINVGPVHENSLQCTETAEISTKLFQLKYLKTLSFFSCFLSPHHPQSIPATGWETLSSTLESLEFRRNPWLVGQIPASLSCLSRLQSLVMPENALLGVVPASVGNLVSLNRLVLAGNRFTGQIPTTIGMLKRLLILDLSRNKLSGEIPTSLGELNSLLKLDLSTNSLRGKLLDELGGMRNLTLLDLRNNSLSGGLPQSFAQMAFLEEMLVGSNPLIDGCLDIAWERLQSLVTLDVSSSKCQGSIPETLKALKRLRFLAVNDNSFTGILPPKLAEMPSVSGMYLNGNNLSGVLDFPKRFFEKMGRRLVVWGNTNLCYPSDLPESSAPYGVSPCKEWTANNYSKNQLGNISNPTFDSIRFHGCGIALRNKSWHLFLSSALLLFLLIS